MSGVTPFPELHLGGRTFSRLLLGHNPFLGGSYMSRARSRLYAERFTTVESIERIIVRATEMGVRGMMASLKEGFTELLEAALHGAADETGYLQPTIMIVSPGFEAELDTYRRLNCQVMLVHGQWTDALYVKAERTMQPTFAQTLERIRAEGFVPGYSTHNGGEVVPAAEPFAAVAVNTPVNKLGWRMCPCEEMVLSALRQTEKKVIAMKPLAMGRLAPREGMEYVCRLPHLDGIVVGIGHEYEVDETFGVAGELLK